MPAYQSQDDMAWEGRNDARIAWMHAVLMRDRWVPIVERACSEYTHAVILMRFESSTESGSECQLDEEAGRAS